MGRVICSIAIFCLPQLVPTICLALPEQQASVSDAAGHTATSGVVRSVSAVGQSGGYAFSSGGTVLHYGGFVGACTLLPSLDTDGDGIANELDNDNDGDDLSDADEVMGTPWLPATATSNPNEADTDGDGAPDGDEAVAGTHPGRARSGDRTDRRQRWLQQTEWHR